MKASKLLSLTVLLFIQAAVTTVFAQDKLKAGDTISGIIRDSIGPMIWVNVVELDSSDNVVAHTVTDFGGIFHFRLVNPDDRMQIPCVGYETVVLTIDTTYFEIKMKEEELMQDNTTTPDTRPRVRGIMEENRTLWGNFRRMLPGITFAGMSSRIHGGPIYTAYILSGKENNTVWCIRSLITQRPEASSPVRLRS